LTSVGLASFYVQVCFFDLDRGNDNWLVKYEMPDVEETPEDVS